MLFLLAYFYCPFQLCCQFVKNEKIIFFRYNHVSLVRLLVANGADVNALHPPSAGDVASKLTPRFSPLSSIFADVSSGSKDEYSMLLILEYLLNKGAFVHWRQVRTWKRTLRQTLKLTRVFISWRQEPLLFHELVSARASE